MRALPFALEKGIYLHGRTHYKNQSFRISETCVSAPYLIEDQSIQVTDVVEPFLT